MMALRGRYDSWWRLLLSSVLFVFVSNSIFAQQPNFKNYSGEILPSGNVYCAFQERQGFMWFGTDRGAVRFDGYTFTTYTTQQGLSDNEVFNFFEDSAGRIWFLTLNGKLSYWKDNEIYNSATDPSIKDMEFSTAISGMYEGDDGTLWVSSMKDGMSCRHPDGTISRFAEDGTLGDYKDLSSVNFTYGFFPANEQEFILLKRVALYKVTFNERNTSVVTVKRFENSPYFENMPKCLKISNTEAVYKNFDEVYIFNYKEDKSTLAHSLPTGEVVFGLSQDPSRLWFCTSLGAFPYDKHTRKTGEAYLKEHRITSVLQDREGNYWFTSLGQGIFFCTSLSMNGYNMSYGLKSETVTCLAKDSKDRVWLGYGRGKAGEPGAVVSYIDRGKLKHVTLSELSYLRRLSSISMSVFRDRVWISTSAGLVKYENGNVQIRPGFIRCILELPNSDSLWFGTSGPFTSITYDYFNQEASEFSQVAQKFLSKRIHPRTLSEALPYVGQREANENHPENVRTIVADVDARLWIGSPKGAYISDSAVTRFEKVFPIQYDVQVNDILELKDRSMVLATSGTGVALVKDRKHFLTIDEDRGLSSNICNALAVDDDNVLWVATNEGLNRVEGIDDSIHVEFFDVNDGLMSNEVTDVLIANDTVWVATKGGLNFFHKDSLRKHHAIPLMFIDKLLVDGEPVVRGDDLAFNYNENDISIHYTGLSFSNGSKTIYRYKLHRDDPWRFTKNTSVYLPTLASGEYEFIVSSKGRLDKWSDEASIKFSIAKPFWKTVPFILLCIFGFLFLTWITIAGFERRRRREMEQSHRIVLSELKSLRAQMNPHFLFNALNSIQGVLMKRNVEEAQDYLGRFGKLMRTILDHADKSSISIAEELDSITNYLEIEQLRAHQFTYNIVVDPALDIYNQEIPAMIIQPFVENSIWHGFTNKDGSYLLTIKFELINSDQLLIEVRDNGIGRRKAMAQRSSKHKSKGMQLVKERIDVLNYKATHKISLHIVDLEDEAGGSIGTAVQIVIPVNN